MKFQHIITGQLVEPSAWQQQLKIGDHYMDDHAVASTADADGNMEIWGPLPTIYGRIESDEPCHPGFFYVMAFSQWCPDGELGLMCIVEPTRFLTPAEFDAARQAGWPDKFSPYRPKEDNGIYDGL